MAQKTSVTLLCDLSHDGETEATETTAFSWDGTDYEIDACTTHAKALREAVEPYTLHARRTTAARPGAKRRRGRDRQHSAAVREWANQRGYKIGDRGRIPVSVIEEYEAAQRAPVLTPSAASVAKVAEPEPDEPVAADGGEAPQPTKSRQEMIREWAKENGITVADRGRVPKTVIAQYEEAQKAAGDAKPAGKKASRK